MKRTLAIGDIHGGYKALQQVLERAEVTEKDKLIFLGDYVDGWSENTEVVSELIQLSQKNACIFIRGNHDVLFEKWLADGEKNEQWLRHGGQSSLNSYSKLSASEKEAHLTFLKTLVSYHIDPENRLFVHAGFRSSHGPKMEYYDTAFYWDRTLWETALCLDKKLTQDHRYYPNRLKLFKEIYIGHTPVIRIGETEPVQAANVWNLDTGAAFKGPLTILDINSKKYWQSDPVWTLYPEEQGRN